MATTSSQVLERVRKKNTKIYSRIEDRWICSGLPLERQPPKLHEGPPYDVAIIPVILDRIANGELTTRILASDPALPKMNEFIGYIRKDPKLYEMYLDAKMSRAECLADKGEMAAEAKDEFGNDILEDPARSKLKVDFYKWSAGICNRDVFGEKKDINITNKLDVTEAMAHAERRVQKLEDARVIEGELIEPLDPLQVLGLDE